MKTSQNPKIISDSFTKIFWGLLFIALNIAINGIDLILPDFLGYILITDSLRNLSTIHPPFTKVQTLSTILIFLSLANLIETTHIIPPYGNIAFQINQLFPITIIGSILSLIMIWKICNGIISLAFRTGNHQLATVATKRRNLYTTTKIIKYCCLIIIFIIPQLVSIIIFPIIILSVFPICLIMGLMKKSAKEIII